MAVPSVISRANHYLPGLLASLLLLHGHTYLKVIALDSTFRYTSMYDALGGSSAVCDRLPTAPAVYSWFRGFNLSDELEPDDFVSAIRCLVEAPGAPVRSARLGLHEVSLTATSELSEKKLARLAKLAQSATFRRQLVGMMTHSSMIQAALYVGKARDLQARTRQHLNPSSELACRLYAAGIEISECVLAYAVLDELDEYSDEALTLVEDILTRICRPGFVLRPG